VERLQEELAQFRTLYIQSQRENEELRQRLRELQSGLDLFPPSGLRLLESRVVGATSNLRDDVLVVRGGRREGVTSGDSVAVVDGVHLVGRVIDVEARTCEVLPISSPRAEMLGARVYVAEPDVSFACQLEPVGNGRLRGPLTQDAEGVEQGQVVRLDDPDWPDLAQALIIGEVESVERSEESPLRRIVTVRPRFALSRVRGVTLRLPADPGDAP
jgi:cell shape-determining protein MreC